MRVFLLAPVLLGSLLVGPGESRAEEPASLSVAGEARLERPADELRLTLAVVSEGSEAAATTTQNSQRMEGVLEALTQAGLAREEVETGRFSVSPRYDQRPPQAPRDWKPGIIGYRVENSIRVETSQIERAGALIDAAVGAGANSVQSIAFGLADDRAHRAEAIRAATAHARADATTLAEAAGVRLARLLSARLDDAAAPPVPLRRQGEAFMMA
ncbi:MAG: SIMPL domain-containing protein, partial [Myxococcota bacterium]